MAKGAYMGFGTFYRTLRIASIENERRVRSDFLARNLPFLYESTPGGDSEAEEIVRQQIESINARAYARMGKIWTPDVKVVGVDPEAAAALLENVLRARLEQIGDTAPREVRQVREIAAFEVAIGAFRQISA